MPLVDHRSSKQLRSHTGAADDSSRAFDVCVMNGHGPFVPLDPSADRISDLPVLHRKSLRVTDQRPPSGATCIIPFAFACTYEGVELHPRVLAIRLPFRVERDAIPDLLSRSPCSNNIRRNARSPCVMTPCLGESGGNLSRIVEARLFKMEHFQTQKRPTEKESPDGPPSGLENTAVHRLNLTHAEGRGCDAGHTPQ
jgi:hypothetical protein